MTVSCHRAPPAGGQPPRDHACDLPFPILDFWTSWVFPWPPSWLTNHWAAPHSPESLVVAPLQDQRKSLETAMESSVIFLDRRFGEGVGAGLKQKVLEQQPVDYSGQAIAVIFPTRGRRRLLFIGEIEVSYQGNQLGHVPHSPSVKNHHEGRCFL